ncbi:hypothetical protein N305_00106, partial [Manacus vitellinus]
MMTSKEVVKKRRKVVMNKHHQKIPRVPMTRRKQKNRQVLSLPPRFPQQQPKGLMASLIRFVCSSLQ